MQRIRIKRIGLIGVGEIGRAIVTGLYEGGNGGAGDDESPQVFLSPRGARTAAELSARHEGVRVCADNQEVVDRSDVVIVAVRREDRHEALAGLRVGGDKLVLNVMAGVAGGELRRILATDAPLVRAVPLPSIRERRSVTVTFPSHPVADALFGRLGGVLPVADEAAFDVFSALTGTLTSHYAYLATLTSWAAGQGIDSDDADRYVRGLFQGVGRALSDESRSLDRLAADHETPGGNNERIRTTWFGPANAEALHRALDALLADLR
ncbi:NAD(P)-binding domain-containing protein [Streptomyces sp. NPDC093510]|uniref:NAD(P)-binding domain-containing protein n=1 Tax=Streptomyces sp. NPDC093510 TaxID=3155199 RepID=UPI00343DCA34